MKIILTQEVEHVGSANEVVDVAAGYARNYLLPRGLAMSATKSAMANLDNIRAQQEKREAKLRGAAEETARSLEGKTLRITARVGEAGRLYGSVGTQDIAQALKKQFGIELDRRNVTLPEAIREAGQFTIPVKLHRDVQVELPVEIGA